MSKVTVDDTAFQLGLAEALADFKVTGQEIVVEVGMEVVAIASALVKVGPGNDPEGHIQGSISMTPDLDPRGPSVLVGTSNPHALFLEYGTYKDAAQPFMRPALARVGALMSAGGGLSKFKSMAAGRGRAFVKRASIRSGLRTAYKKGELTTVQARGLSRHISKTYQFRGRHS